MSPVEASYTVSLVNRPGLYFTILIWVFLSMFSLLFVSGLGLVGGTSLAGITLHVRMIKA